jgi:uncharacterized SAM-binding protein YcdF (DUF218 family)
VYLGVVVMVVVCFGSILLVVTMWYEERTLRPKHGRGLIGGNFS